MNFKASVFTIEPVAYIWLLEWEMEGKTKEILVYTNIQR